jgi:NAD(P)H-hydrate epimerase
MIGKAKTPLILTPHPGEMQSLLKGSDVLDIEKDRIDTAISFARETNTHLVLKGVPTVIASPEAKAFVNSTGNPGMATAGTGDVLTGLIAGLLGQTGNALHASIVGVYLHGLAGDLAASKRGQHSLIATDLIDEIPAAYRALRPER